MVRLRINDPDEINSAPSSVSSASLSHQWKQSNESLPSYHHSKQSNKSLPTSNQSKQWNESLPYSRQSKQSNEPLLSSNLSKQSNESLSSSLDVISVMLVLPKPTESSKKGRKQAVHKTTVCITEEDILCNLKQKEAGRLDKEAQKEQWKRKITRSRWNTTAYCSYYFDYLLSLPFKGSCKSLRIYFR